MFRSTRDCYRILRPQLHLHAVDPQVYMTVNPENMQTTINNLEQCLRHVQVFFALIYASGGILRKLK